MEPNDIQEFTTEVKDAVQSLFVADDEPVLLLIIGVLAQGHVLVEDIPGVGKTTLVRALARALGCSFGRIQFTPDVMPSDVTGVHIYNESAGEFEFRAGPVHNEMVLADEINRTPPKTQSSLLEAMQERQVTADGETIPLPTPFTVVATQNPIEHEGTYPLPTAQLDRFALRLTIGYPTREREQLMIDRFAHGDPWEGLPAVTTAETIVAAQRAVQQVEVHDDVTDYILRLVQQTRDDERLRLGASPRAALGLQRLAMAAAAVDGRRYVLPDDVKYVFAPALNHRLLLEPEHEWREDVMEEILSDVVARVSVPVSSEMPEAAR